MRLLSGVLFLWAFEPVGHADPSAVPTRPSTISVVLPSVAAPPATVFPDVTAEGRWPLSVTAHPTFEPRFDIAGALARPGIAWIDLCRMGARHRHLSGQRDLQAYLSAWCTAEAGDVPSAVQQLSTIVSPVVAGLANALDPDLVNMLVQYGDAMRSEHLLAQARLDRVELFDLLAASYYDLGKVGDAAEINDRALERDRATSDAARCHRLTRRVVLDVGKGSSRLSELEALGNEPLRSAKQLPTDATCRRLYATVICSTRGFDGCRPYFEDVGIDRARAELGHVIARWPRHAEDSAGWLHVAADAARARQDPGAYLLEEAALAAALAVAPCSATVSISRIAKLAHELEGTLPYGHRSRTTLSALVSKAVAMGLGQQSCEAAVGPTR